MSSSADPEVVVQRQLDAYNARNLTELLEIYASDASLWEHPNRLLALGTDALRERFAARFAEPNLHAHLRQRMVMGNLVVDHETVTRTFPEGPGTLEMIMLYEVRDGRIAQAWSLVGPKCLDP